MYLALVVFALAIFGYGLVAARVERAAVSGPLLYTAFGLAVGPAGLDMLHLDVDGETIQLLAELTLAVVLFADASKADLGVLARHRAIPLRLLLLGLPFTIFLGYAAGRALFPDLAVLETALLATMLAPTDAALGSAVVSNPQVPAPIREGLKVESGLNDGICVPILFLFLALAEGSDSEGLAVRLLTEAIGIGIAVGLTLTGVGVALARRCIERKWFGTRWGWVILVALAFACFATAQLLGGSGFIAGFTGGLFFGYRVRRQAKTELLEITEGMENVLSLITWVIFGAAVVGPALRAIDLRAIGYGLLSLTVVRMAPAFLALLGTKVDTPSKLFIGWFGPRGLASVVFIVIVASKQLENTDRLVLSVVTTVTLSIILHGISANPLVAALSTREARSTKGA